MVRNFRVAVRSQVEPYFVATGCLAVKLETSGLQLSDNFAITEA